MNDNVSLFLVFSCLAWICRIAGANREVLMVAAEEALKELVCEMNIFGYHFDGILYKISSRIVF